VHFIHSIILGIVEGITEFLPISSTAHLRLVEPLLNIDLTSGYWKTYTVVIQLGAILSIVWLFWQRTNEFRKTFPLSNFDDTMFTHPLGLIAIAFLVTVGPCWAADHFIMKNLERVGVIAAALIIGGIVMWIVDVIAVRSPSMNRTENMEKMKPWQAIWIGLVQVLSAAFPGTSRSMSTIAGGQVAGLTRGAAVEFSFFLAVPTMVAASGYKLMQALKHPAEGLSGAPPHQWAILAIGFIVSFLVALPVNAWFITWVRRRGFGGFAVYRIILGIVVLLTLARH
jgi:undecaprenyl-diphosphatase